MKKRLYFLFNLALCSTIIVGLMFAWFDYRKLNEPKDVVGDYPGSLRVFYANGTDISIDNLVKSNAPDYNSICDDESCYRSDFVVSNPGLLNAIINGNISINSNSYENDKLMFSLYDGETKVINDTKILNNSIELFNNVSIEENKNIKVYTLFIWLDNTASTESGSFTATLNVSGDKSEKDSYVYYDLSKSSVEISEGSTPNKLLIKGTENGSEIKFQNAITIDNENSSEKEIDKTIKIVFTGSTTTNNINIISGNPVIILSNVNIDLSNEEGKAGIMISDGTTVKLNIFGENIIKSGTNKDGIDVSDNSKVTIIGPGSLSTISGVDTSSDSTKLTIKEPLKTTYTCENGILNGETCEIDATPKYSCSSGTLNDKSCVKVATMKHICESGTLNSNDNKCYYQFYSTECMAIGVCKTNSLPPSGKTLCDELGWTKTRSLSDEFGSAGVECSKSSESKYVCDDNWTNTGTNCKIDAKISYECKTGTLKNNKCIFPAMVKIN